MSKELNYKQRVLLELIDFTGGRIDKLKLFKLAFLLHTRIEKFYNFLPYHYGPYSFEMNNDIISLQKKRLITEEKNEFIFLRKNSEKIISEKILNMIEVYIKWDTKQLLDYIYENYPFYSSFSKLRNIQNTEIQGIYEPQIYTMGYEGLSIDLFITVLLNNKVKKVIDVRNEPYSFKYGFSMYWLKKYLPEWGIEYENFRDLGVEKEYRLNFKTFYPNKLRGLKSLIINRIIPEIKSKKVVFLCFEKDLIQCHRYLLAQELQVLTDNYKICDLRP